jgi:peptidoglycan/xylan/chitin deacetylase (PgdA/CDA1 family)
MTTCSRKGKPVELDQRLAYSAIKDRPVLRLPGSARLVVWPIVVLETWDISRPMPRHVLPPAGALPVPDYLNWSWHEYGMRIGFWRLKELMDVRNIVPSVSINAAVCTVYPQVAAACLEGGWEFVAHGIIQRPIHEIADEAAMIRQTIRELEAFAGRRPRGWASPGLAQTRDSLDHLAAAGIEYACDWIFDDQPCKLVTKHGTIVALPYSVDLNDVPAMVVHRQSAQTFRNNVCDAFERLYAEGARSARVLTLVLHPYICAASHRIRYLEEAIDHMRRPGVLFWTGEQIFDWYRAARTAR